MNNRDLLTEGAATLLSDTAILLRDIATNYEVPLSIRKQCAELSIASDYQIHALNTCTTVRDVIADGQRYGFNPIYRDMVPRAVEKGYSSEKISLMFSVPESYINQCVARKKYSKDRPFEGLPSNIVRRLLSHGVYSLDDLRRIVASGDIRKISLLGKKSIAVIREFLESAK